VGNRLSNWVLALVGGGQENKTCSLRPRPRIYVARKMAQKEKNAKRYEVANQVRKKVNES